MSNPSIEGRTAIGLNQAYLLLTATVFLWAVGVVIARWVHDEIPLIGLSFWRWCAAVVFLLPFVWRDLIARSALVKKYLPLLAIQGMLIVGSGTLLFYALNFTTAINATLVNATQPVLTVVLAWMVLNDRLNRIQIIGIVCAFTGVGIMVTRASWSVLAQLDFNIGDMLVILAICGYALYAINIRKLPGELGTFPALFVILVSGSLLLLPFYMAETVYLKPVIVSFKLISIIMILALLVSILSISMWNTANAVAGPGRAAIFVNLMPVYGSILAILFLGEKLYLYHVAGALLVCAGIFLVVRKH
jgi:drug/metabolite transporter (DMT)-like permease